MENDKRCIACGKKLKYGNDFYYIPAKRSVLFVIDELDIEMPIYLEKLKHAESIDKFERYLNEIDKKESEIKLSEPYVPDTGAMSEDEWNAWCGVGDDSNYTKNRRSIDMFPYYMRGIADALNHYYCNEYCFNDHLKLAKKQAKQHIYKQKSPQTQTKFNDTNTAEELPMSVIRDILIEKYGRCRICGDDRVIEAHHIIAKEFGGKDTLSNVIPLCPTCHKLAHGVGVIKNG